MTDVRLFRVGILPLFMLTLNLSRSETGVRAILSFYIYKFGLHVGLSTIE